jgi:hypothetical protein
MKEPVREAEEAEDEIIAELRQIRRDMLAEYGGDTLKMSEAISRKWGIGWTLEPPKP